jgi:hypothetical protein
MVLRDGFTPEAFDFGLKLLDHWLTRWLLDVTPLTPFLERSVGKLGKELFSALFSLEVGLKVS